MRIRRFTNIALQLVFGFAFMALAAGPSIAQDGRMRVCQGTPKGTCVEVLIRYHEAPQPSAYGSQSKIKILDPVSRNELKSCEACDPKVKGSCTKPDAACQTLQGATLQDASSIILLQSNKSPGCYYFCSGGWCREECF